MMKKSTYIIIGIVILLIIGVLIYTSYQLIQPELGLPPTIVYKTKGDYYNLVPVLLSEDKSKVIGYPDIKDVGFKGEFPYPIKLHQGYLLDVRGIWSNSAFLSITYEDYSQLNETPLSTELYNIILDDNPFIELYDCGNRPFTIKPEFIEKLNERIDNYKLDTCEKLI